MIPARPKRPPTRLPLVALAALCACYSGRGEQRGPSGGSSGAGEDAGSHPDDDDADDDADDDGGDDGEPSGPLSECRLPQFDVYQRMDSACFGCHHASTNLPLFADFNAFEQLLAYNPAFVTPGDPEGSALIALLEGNGSLPLAQMPPTGQTFAELADAGATEISMDEIREWIANLESCNVPDDDDVLTVARISAAQIQRSLLQQLELTPMDVQHEGRFPLDDPTFPHPDLAPWFDNAQQRWVGLGGPDYLDGSPSSDAWSNLFIQIMIPTAQAWCRRSIELDRDALFRHVGRDSNSATDEAAIRDNIRYLFLLLLSLEATDLQVNEMYDEIYLHYEAAENSRVAWAGVCSSMIRNPLWLSR